MTLPVPRLATELRSRGECNVHSSTGFSTPISAQRILECLTDTHAECVTIHALSDIRTKVDVILFAQQESQSAAAAGQEVSTFWQKARAWDHAADTSEFNGATFSAS